MKVMTSLMVGLAVVAAGTGGAHAAPPFEISLNGPETFLPGEQLSSPFTGTLSVAGVGVPNQTIEIAVDSQVAGTASTSVQGSYAVSLPAFTGTADRTVRATAFGGTALETSIEIVVRVVRYELQVVLMGTGTGSVTSDPLGIQCPSTCTFEVPATSEVSLTGVADPGVQFSGWSGSCMGSGTCIIVMNADRTVNATFSSIPQTLSVGRSGTSSGTVTSSPAGINCGFDCSEEYTAGTVVTLTATASGSSIFAGWSGGGCSGTGLCTVTMSAATNVVATFNLAQYTLSVSRSGSGASYGTVSSSGINCGADCSEVYQAGTPVWLSASTYWPYTFLGWSGACSGFGSCFVVMESNKSVTAHFG